MSLLFSYKDFFCEESYYKFLFNGILNCIKFKSNEGFIYISKIYFFLEFDGGEENIFLSSLSYLSSL